MLNGTFLVRTLEQVRISIGTTRTRHTKINDRLYGTIYTTRVMLRLRLRLSTGIYNDLLRRMDIITSTIHRTLSRVERPLFMFPRESFI